MRLSGHVLRVLCARLKVTQCHHEISEMDNVSAETIAVRAQLEEVTKRLHGAGLLGEKLLVHQQRLQEALAVPAQLSAQLSELERELDNIKRDAGESWLEVEAFSLGTEPWKPTEAPSTPKWGGNSAVSPVKQALSMRRRPAKLSTRAHDLEFATEIGQGLLTEVRRLQGILSERDAQWKAAEHDKRGLEQQIEALELRLKTLGESEERYKEENWNLELRTQDLNQQMSEASAAELRVTQENVRLQKQAQMQIEMVETLRVRETELCEELEQIRTRSELEAANFRRTQAELLDERSELIRQIEELKAELATRRLPLHWQEEAVEKEDWIATHASDVSFEDILSEQRSPFSPIKCTPSRNIPLEMETMGASFSHAQRTICGLRGVVQREKLEKIKLKQLLNEAFERLEKLECEDEVLPKKGLKQRSRFRPLKGTLQEMKKYTNEIVVESDSEWKDEQDPSEVITDISNHIEEDLAADVPVSEADGEWFEASSIVEDSETKENIKDWEDKRLNHMKKMAYANDSDFSSGLNNDSDIYKEHDLYIKKKYTLSLDTPQMNQSLFKELQIFNQDNYVETVDVGTMTDEVSDLTQTKMFLFNRNVDIAENHVALEGSDKNGSQPCDIISSVNTETNHSDSTLVNHCDTECHDVTRLDSMHSRVNSVNGVSQSVDKDDAVSSTTESQSRPFSFSSIVSVFRLGRRKSIQISSSIPEASEVLPGAVSNESNGPDNLFNSFEIMPNLELTSDIEVQESNSKSTNNIEYIKEDSGFANNIESKGDRFDLKSVDKIKDSDDKSYLKKDIQQEKSYPKLANIIKRLENEFNMTCHRNNSKIIKKRSQNNIMDLKMTPNDKINNQEVACLASKFSTNSTADRFFRSPSLNKSIGSKVLRKSKTHSTLRTTQRNHEKQAFQTEFNKQDVSPGFLSHRFLSKKITLFSTPVDKRKDLSKENNISDSLRATKGSSVETTEKLPHSPFSSASNVENSHSQSSDFKAFAYSQSSIDPKIIHSITQAMIGEYLWKYTRKHARQELSRNRHLRFFWVHPYSRSLYWSKHNPSTSYGQELYAKSAFIESVKVVYDNNMYPEDVYNKSIVVITPTRVIKFTASSSDSHELWYQALLYLTSRINPFPEAFVNKTDDTIEAKICDSISRQACKNLTSKNSKGSLSNFSTSSEMTPLEKNTSLKKQSSLSRLNQTIRSSANSSTTSLKFKKPLPKNYASSETERSTNDRYERINSIIRHANLENVRSCCDGRHDVSTLSYRSKSFSSDSHYSRSSLQSRSSSLVYRHFNASANH